MTASAELRGDELIAERHLPAKPERVWAAFTSPTGIAAFWGGSRATVPPESVDVDLRPAPHELVFDEPVTGPRRLPAAPRGHTRTENA